MKQDIFNDLEDFWKNLPNAGEVSTFWQDVKDEVPNCVDVVVLQDDMFDTVGMASIMLYRMREHNMKVPVFYLIGDYNPLLQCENTEKMQIKLSVKCHQRRIQIETTLMLRQYQRLFCKRHWAY